MTKSSDKIAWGYWPSMKAAAPFQVWKCLITDEMLGNFVRRTSQCILVIQPNFGHESSAELTDRIAMEVFIGVMCLAREIRSKRVWKNFGLLTEMALKTFLLIMNQSRFVCLIRCILELINS